MTPIRKPAPAFVGVVAGQVATLDLPIGKTYHAIYLAGTVKNTGAPPAITDIFGPGPINVKRNGKIQRQHLVTELDALNAFDKEDLRSNFYGATGQIQGQLTMPTLVVGTSASFAVGDIIGYTGGTVVPGGQQAQFICVTAGGLTTANWRVKNPGQYSVAPTSTTPVIISSAAGSIGTGTVTPSLSLMTSLLPNGLGLSGSAAYAAITPYTGDTVTFVIGIFFADLSRDSMLARAAFAWPTKWPVSANPAADLTTNGDGTQQLQSLQIEVPIANNANCSGQTLLAWMETTDDLGLLVDANGNVQGSANFVANTASPLTAIVKWKRTTVPYTAAGDLPILPPRRDALQQLSLFCQTGDAIGSMQVVKDGTTMLNMSKNMNDETLCKRGMNELGLDPLRFDFLADYSDNPLDAINLNGSNEFTVTPNLSNATATNKVLIMVIKQYGPPD